MSTPERSAGQAPDRPRGSPARSDLGCSSTRQARWPVAAAAPPTGVEGYAPRGPYDRILATCAVAAVPPAWVEQLAEDGLLVTPLAFGDALAVLRRGGTQEATGWISAQRVAFMPLRAPDHQPVSPQIPRLDSDQRQVLTDLDLATWSDPEWRLWLALHLPTVQVADRIDHTGACTGVVAYTPAAAASVNYTGRGSGAWSVTRDSASLWDSVEQAWQSWQRYGRPARSRIGITTHVTDGTVAWLDDPDGPRWPLTTLATAARGCRAGAHASPTPRQPSMGR